MATDDFLSRTTLFAQRAVRWPAPGPPSDPEVREALTCTEVTLHIPRHVASRLDVQLAGLTATNLLSRTGFRVGFDVPEDVRLAIPHPMGDEQAGLRENLRALARTVRPPASSDFATDRAESDVLSLAVEPRDGSVHLAWTCWSGSCNHDRTLPGDDIGTAVGPIVAAHLGCLEIFKGAIRRLALERADSSSEPFPDAQPAATVLSLEGFDLESSATSARWQRPVLDLADTVFVSAGAMIHASIFALSSTVDLRGRAVVVDPGVLDEPDLNRYSLARFRDLDRKKSSLLTSVMDGWADLDDWTCRYQELPSALTGGPIAVVGVDHIPTRSDVQQHWPDLLLCGATTRDAIVLSRHSAVGSGACCGCVHPPSDAEEPGPVPTLAPVSGLAGVMLAAELIKTHGRARPQSDPLPEGSRIDAATLQLGRPLNLRRSRPHPRKGCACGRAER